MAVVNFKKPKELKGYHWHHIIPKHLGGTDELDNLILLSPYEHALAHLKLFNEYGLQADAWAYNRLNRQANLNLNEIKYLKPNLGKKFSDEINAKKGRSGNDNPMSRIEIKEKHNKIMKSLTGIGLFSVMGKDNKSSKKIKINDDVYDCIIHAANALSVSRLTIRKWLNGSKPNKSRNIYSVIFI
jgi:hypothetical protein